MNALWVAATTAAALLAAVQIAILTRQRHLLLGDAQRRRALVRYMTGPFVPTAHLESVHELAVDTSGAETLASLAAPEGGVIYVDTRGQCTFADRGARQMLRWTAGDLSLPELLVGGQHESEQILQELVKLGNVEPHTTLLSGSIACQLSAVALRDRDDNFWGGALFVRPTVATRATASRR